MCRGDRDVALRSIKSHHFVIHGMEHQQSLKTKGDTGHRKTAKERAEERKKKRKKK